MARPGLKKAVVEADPIEAELRLTGEPDVLKAAFAALPVGKGSKERTKDLESRYFDTADQALRAAGLAFRVRSDGNGHRQTLKAGDDAKAAVIRRGEWETALDDDQPKPEALPKAAHQRLPKVALEGGLEPAFTTRMRRKMREVSTSGEEGPPARIEAAMDLGSIETKSGTLPIAELELELLDGPPDALYRLALDLQNAGPLHLETRSKSGRAYDRLANRPPDWQRATTPALYPANSVDDAMAAILESCFDQWLANQAAAIDGRDPEGVHQMRVALRRLRSALSVFRKLIPPDQLTWLQTEAKRTIGALGDARDWDVFQAELLAPVLASRPGDPGLEALRNRARARARSSYRRARTFLQSSDYTRFVLSFGQWLEQCGWREQQDFEAAAKRARPIVSFAKQLLNKRRKRVVVKGENFAELSVEQRHELRIALKKLRYAVEFFKPVFDAKAVKPFLLGVKQLQEDLGHLNDVAVAETLLADVIARPGKHDVRTAAGLVIGWHARGVALVEPKLREDWKAFRAEPAFWKG